MGHPANVNEWAAAHQNFISTAEMIGPRITASLIDLWQGGRRYERELNPVMYAWEIGKLNGGAFFTQNRELSHELRFLAELMESRYHLTKVGGAK